jgi:hypothetical protein
MRQSAVLKDPFTSDIVQTGRTSWQGVRKQLRASARSADSLQNVANDILSSLRSELEQVQREIGQTSDREEIKSRAQNGRCAPPRRPCRAVPFARNADAVPTAEEAFDNAYTGKHGKLVRLEVASRPYSQDPGSFGRPEGI